MNSSIQILLATLNSSRFLKEQLDSILKQDHSCFELLIRDAGSSDSTLQIIDEYKRCYPEKIRFLGSGKTGAGENFNILLEASDAELVMFSDHDDVWMPDKISRSVKRYQSLAAECREGTPILVFTDSSVVDHHLKRIADSMLAFQHLSPFKTHLHNLILQNVASGNTMLLNRALVSLALPIPAAAVMHDHWIMLAAAAFGKIGYLDQSTLLYRQHENNVYGAFHYSPFSIFFKFCQSRRRILDRFYQNIKQAAAFGQRYETMLSPQDRKMFGSLAGLERMGFLKRRLFLIQNHLWKQGILRNIGMMILI